MNNEEAWKEASDHAKRTWDSQRQKHDIFVSATPDLVAVARDELLKAIDAHGDAARREHEAFTKLVTGA